MPKIGMIDVKPDTDKLAETAVNLSGATNSSLFSLQGIKQIKDVIEGIRLMVSEAKNLQSPPPLQAGATGQETVVQSPLQAGSGVSKEQLFTFARQFLDNMIKQGYGNKSISQAVDSIPFTISQIRGFLK